MISSTDLASSSPRRQQAPKLTNVENEYVLWGCG